MQIPVHVRALVLFMVHQTSMMLGTVMGLTVAFPAITEDFGTTVDTTVWIQLAYSLALAGSTFSVGLSSTLLDKRKLVVFGLFADVVLMVVIFYTSSIYVVIVCRFFSAFVRVYPWLILQVMGIGGFPPHQRGKVLGIVAVTQGFGMLASVPVAGFVTEFFGWRWLFMGTAMFYLALAPLAWRLLPSQARAADAPRPRLSDFDVPGSVLMLIGMVSALVAVQVFVRGISPLVALTLGVTGFSALLLFLWVELQARTPVLPFALFRIRGVLMGAMQAVSFGWVNGSLQLLLPFLLIVGYGWSLTYAASVMLAMNLVRPASGMLSGWCSDRYGSSAVILSAAVVAGTGQLLLASLGTSPSVLWVVGALVLMGTGQAFMQTANQRQLFTSIPREQLHAAPSTSLVLTTSGSATGQAVVSAALGTTIAVVSGGTGGSGALASTASSTIVVITIVFGVSLTMAQVLPRRLSEGPLPVSAVEEPPVRE